MEYHINKLKGKAEATIQTIFNLAGNHNFLAKYEMKTIWKLIQTCLIHYCTPRKQGQQPKSKSTEINRISRTDQLHYISTPGFSRELRVALTGLPPGLSGSPELSDTPQIIRS